MVVAALVVMVSKVVLATVLQYEGGMRAWAGKVVLDQVMQAKAATV